MKEALLLNRKHAGFWYKQDNFGKEHTHTDMVHPKFFKNKQICFSAQPSLTHMSQWNTLPNTHTHTPLKTDQTDPPKWNLRLMQLHLWGLVEVLRFTHCPMLDVDNFIDSLTHAHLNNLMILDMRGVPAVSSLHMWTISFHAPNLRQFFVSATMSSYFARPVCEHCRHLSDFDCVPLCIGEWQKLATDYPRVTFGTNVRHFM